jgi:hypothetical protein
MANRVTLPICGGVTVSKTIDDARQRDYVTDQDAGGGKVSE